MESEVIYKVCDICQKNKPVWEFRVNKKYEDGFNYHCKECRGKVNDYLKQKKQLKQIKYVKPVVKINHQKSLAN